MKSVALSTNQVTSSNDFIGQSLWCVKPAVNTAFSGSCINYGQDPFEVIIENDRIIVVPTTDTDETECLQDVIGIRRPHTYYFFKDKNLAIYWKYLTDLQELEDMKLSVLYDHYDDLVIDCRGYASRHNIPEIEQYVIEHFPVEYTTMRFTENFLSPR